PAGSSTWTSSVARCSAAAACPAWSCIPPAAPRVRSPSRTWTPPTPSTCGSGCRGGSKTMTTPDPAAPATVVAGHRLHPMSWLFELIAQLRQFLVPLLALVVFGQGDRSELWPLAGVAVLVAASLWRYSAFRYQPEADQLVLRTGLLSRNVRVVPYGRIHNVAVDQTLLHR